MCELLFPVCSDVLFGDVTMLLLENQRANWLNPRLKLVVLAGMKGVLIYTWLCSKLQAFTIGKIREGVITRASFWGN